ncbi:MAG: hypothetical protein ABSH06_30585 [Thermodesulfobacteriota bacterium]|jgi:hypothetical protein
MRSRKPSPDSLCKKGTFIKEELWEMVKVVDREMKRKKKGT